MHCAASAGSVSTQGVGFPTLVKRSRFFALRGMARKPVGVSGSSRHTPHLWWAEVDAPNEPSTI